MELFAQIFVLIKILGTKTKRLIRNDLNLLHFGVIWGSFLKDLDFRNNGVFQAKIN